MNYNRLNNLTGWFVFLIATVVYLMTLESTASLWDCGEYITAAYKLEVGHPPGAPFFMILGRMFSFFAAPENVAVYINALSALSSSFTILFMFWSITMLGKKVMERDGNTFSRGDQIAVLGAGIIGSLAYAFSDSFWFSAVEGEVYAMSSLFTAVIFWAILKWDAEVIELKRQNITPTQSPMRWIVLIFFLFGLAIGVHLLGLLILPAIAFIIYFNQWENINIKGIIICGLISVVALAFIQEGIIPGIVAIASSFEVGFVNSLGAPFFTGTIFFIIVLTALIVYGVRRSRAKNNVILSTVIWSFVTLLIGYASFAVIVIRSNANLPLDENDPENLVTLHSYLKREQYGSWPILSGPYWNSLREGEVMVDGKPRLESTETWGDFSPVQLRRFVVQRAGEDIKGFRSEADAQKWAREKGAGYEVVEKYFTANENTRHHQVPKYTQTTLFPRMYWSNEPAKVQKYKEWSGYTNEAGFGEDMGNDGLRLPTFGENMRYMFRYQMNWMYWRYFMWNFAGRQNDIRGHGDIMRGNWISGINFVDSDRLGDQSELPQFTAENEGHNKFFFLPLVLGLIGLLFHFYRAPKDAFVVFLTFLFTGVAIIIYLNQKPYEPRERDYAFAASFYAFAMWIGIGVLALYEAWKNFSVSEWKKYGILGAGGAVFFLIVGLAQFKAWLVIILIGAVLMGVMYLLRKAVKSETAAATLATLITLIVPAIMGMQGWDDHNRHGKTSARDLAHNYLMSCEKNSVLFTAGDNDTFPLWYYQEVEGKRTDVRVCNLSLMQTDWYTEQMMRRAYESDPLKITFREDQILAGAGNTEQVVFVGMTDMAQAGVPEEAIAQVFESRRKANQAAYTAAYTSFRDQVATALTGMTGKDATSSARLTALREKFTIDAANAKFADVMAMTNGILDLFSMYSNGVLNAEVSQLEPMQAQLQQWEDSWSYMPLKEALDFVKNDDNMITSNGNTFRVFPTNKFILPVNAENAVKSGVITAAQIAECSKEVRLEFTASALMKEQVMMLDFIANNNWKRAVYYSSPANQEVAMALLQSGHLATDGMVWEMTPIARPEGLNPDRMYHNLMDVYEYGDMNKGVLTDNYARDQTGPMRGQFAQLADYYVKKADELTSKKASFSAQIPAIRQSGNARLADSLSNSIEGADGKVVEYRKRAVALIRKSIEEMPLKYVIDYGEPNPGRQKVTASDGLQYETYSDGTIHDYVRILYQAGDKKFANDLGMEVADQIESILKFFANNDPWIAGEVVQDVSAAMGNYLVLYNVSNNPKIGDPSGKLATRTNKFVQDFYSREFPRFVQGLENKAREEGESMRGRDVGKYASEATELKGTLEGLAIQYGILDAPMPQTQTQAAPQRDMTLDAAMQAQPADAVADSAQP